MGVCLLRLLLLSVCFGCFAVCFVWPLLSALAAACSGVQVLVQSFREQGAKRAFWAFFCLLYAVSLFRSLSCVFARIAHTGKGKRAVFLPWVRLSVCLSRFVASGLRHPRLGHPRSFYTSFQIHFCLFGKKTQCMRYRSFVRHLQGSYFAGRPLL